MQQAAGTRCVASRLTLVSLALKLPVYGLLSLYLLSCFTSVCVEINGLRTDETVVWTVFLNSLRLQ